MQNIKLMIAKKIIVHSFNSIKKIGKRVLICPDKFKFSLTSAQVASIIQHSLPSFFQTSTITLADGGEGSIDAISTKLKGQWIACQVLDPLFRKIEAEYYSAFTNEAYIQMARASGLGLLKERERNPLKTTTFGTGQMILQSLKRGSTKINLLIGGSATTDGGIGCASALGYQFYDQNGNILSPIGQNLIKISQVKHHDENIMSLLKKASIAVYTDVTNPLTGINGAAYVYGPQKGANLEQVKQLDRGLQNLNTFFQKRYKIDVNEIKGSGAAGGLGAGCLVFLNAQLLRGIDLIFDVTQFEKYLQWADVVITGQGKYDGQTLEGKTVKGVIDRCLSKNKKVIVLCAISQQADRFCSEHPSVRLIEVLQQEEKQTINKQVTARRLKEAVELLFSEK